MVEKALGVGVLREFSPSRELHSLGAATNASSRTIRLAKTVCEKRGILSNTVHVYKDKYTQHDK